MNLKDGHLDKAKRNREAIDDLLNMGNKHAEWVVTIAFYRAIHLFEAGLRVTENRAGIMNITNHSDREFYIKNKFKEIYLAFSYLRTASSHARYNADGREVFLSKYSQEVIESKLLGVYLNKIETWASKRLRLKQL